MEVQKPYKASKKRKMVGDEGYEESQGYTMPETSENLALTIGKH